VTSRFILRVAPVLLLAALARTALALPKDAAATAKIDEAINVHYLATDFNKAEAQLLGVIKACGKDCSPSVFGRAWMYVGLVRGSGKTDLAGAREAFTKAKESDPATQLDSALATPEVQAEFDAIFGGGAPAKPGKHAAAPATPEAPPVAPGEMECSVDAGSEIELRRPIPISCGVPQGAKKAVLAYKEFGATQFNNLPMTIKEGNARAVIPCSATKMAGALSYVIVIKDGGGNTLGSVGTLEQPAQFNVAQTTLQPPPAFPGEAPPARCAEEVECPPGMPGCTRGGGGGWGDACTPVETCKKGLYCSAGTCENAPSCEVDSDCSTGRCSEGFCDMGEGSGPGNASTGYRKLWVGVHFAPDIYWFKTEDQVCGISSLGNANYACFESNGTPLVNQYGGSGGIPDANLQGGQGKINGGPKLATLRALLSLDYAVTSNLMIGGRLGFAFGGGPKIYKYNSASGTPNTLSNAAGFMPLHAELKGTYHFVSLGKPGLHPYVHAGGGLAQVDAKMTLQVCSPNSKDVNNCRGATDATKNNIYARDVVVWRRTGMFFVDIGGGLLYPFGKNFGAVLNLNLMYMMPQSGIVIEPSLGAAIGF
jgi:hypothetical protein